MEVTSVTVRYFAAARAAAGTEAELVETAPHSTVAQLVRQLADQHGEKLADVLERCSYLVDGIAASDRAVRLPGGGTVDILPPFAGG
ncbi:molybdopterin synthase subunit MoaD2 [Fodinicola feengrottensis]|uniref:Molybdopterin synthase sulfur carrier subunit n=1 Tax=Fodinicola feengrottensis TaxID=435914 RepID=A0ABN2GZ30_9ACTN